MMYIIVEDQISSIFLADVQEWCIVYCVPIS